jgi:L-iditol 2-dehydrogenase
MVPQSLSYAQAMAGGSNGGTRSGRMVALVKRAPGRENVGLEEVPRPVPGPGEALLEVLATGICGTDLHIVADEFPSTPPVVMGHEVTGRVAAVGDRADGQLVGRRFSPETYFYTCDACDQCRSGHRNLCATRRSIGSHVDGGFAPFVLVPVRNLHEVAPGVGEHAGALYEPLACIAQCLCDPAVASPGDSALVIGPGAMGILAAQVLRAEGARVLLVGTPRDRRRLDLAESLGLDVVEVGDLAGRTPDLGFDVVADCSGSEVGIATGLRSTRKGGRYVQIGLAGRLIQLDIDLVCLRELTVTSGFASTPRSWRRAEMLLAAGDVVLDPLVTDVLPLSAWEEAFARTARADGLKLVLDPRPGG